MMLPSGRPGHRAVVRAVGAGALAGAMFLGRAAAKCRPANAAATCAAELLARGLGGRQGGRCCGLVGLSVHPPPVNEFFATLKGQSRDQMQPQVQAYLDANPQVRTELQGIKQPADDFLNRCNQQSNPSNTPLP